MPFVLDCSVTMAWILPDEAVAGTVALRDSLVENTAVVPGVLRPKRNAERSEAEWFRRDASPLEPPPGELGRLGFTTGC